MAEAVAPGSLPRRDVNLWEVVAAVVVADLVVLVGVHALTSRLPYDFGIYYRGGAAAWTDGRPAAAPGWVGTPFAAGVLAVVARAARLADAARALTILNLAVVAAAAAGLWSAVRTRLRPGATLAVVAGCTFLFAPVTSTIWWQQLNLVVLGLAALGFVRVRRGASWSAAALIGVSIALKPIFVLVPIALALRRETRRAGVAACVWAVALTALGQGFLSLRAGDPGLLEPVRAARDFVGPMSDPTGSHVCHPANLSIQANLCRLVGSGWWTGQRIASLVVAAALCAVGLAAVRRYRASSFEYFAMACALSPFLGPIEWTHYQVALVPLLAVLVVHLVATPRPVAWVLLGVAYVGISMVWSPSTVVAGGVADIVGWTTPHASFVLMRTTALFQLLVVAVGVAVLRADAGAPKARAASSPGVPACA